MFYTRKVLIENIGITGSKVHLITCHHIDSTIREKIQDSTLSKAAVKVLVSCQSSKNFKRSFLLDCLLPGCVFHFTEETIDSVLFPPPFGSIMVTNELELQELSNA